MDAFALFVGGTDISDEILAAVLPYAHLITPWCQLCGSLSKALTPGPRCVL